MPGKRFVTSCYVQIHLVTSGDKLRHRRTKKLKLCADSTPTKSSAGHADRRVRGRRRADVAVYDDEERDGPEFVASFCSGACRSSDYVGENFLQRFFPIAIQEFNPVDTEILRDKDSWAVDGNEG